ncbi:MAG: hypothetical protein KKA60_08815 [Proteobacteria bacterium]|nr:hypothetical protein [Pseudomonadota bacterium]
MSTLESIGKEDLKELLNLGWMTHDGMWFYHCLKDLGLEATNRLNLSAVDSLALFEIPRMRKALGFEKERIETMAELEAFINGAFDLIMPRFMRFTHAFVPPNRMTWKWEDGQCFAYKGVRRLGVAEDYRCGVMRRIDRWFELLGVPFTGPGVDRCLMHHTGSCGGEYVFHFPGTES